MFRILFILTILFYFGVAHSYSQACGYVYAKLMVNDASRAPVRNAKFEFLEKFEERSALHGSDLVKWVESDSSYFLSEGICGGHSNVVVRVSAVGFETTTKVVNLWLRPRDKPHIFRITLRRIGSKEVPLFTSYSLLTGRIFDANGALVTGARVTATGEMGEQYSTETSEAGEYSLELPYNQYESKSHIFRDAKFTIKVEKFGFKPSITKDFVFIPSQFGEMRLDTGLEIQSFSHPV